jgi:hypothetical protein
MRPLLALLGLAACSPDARDDAVWTEGASAAASELPPPAAAYTLTLTVPGLLGGVGQMVQVTGAPPAAPVAVFGTLDRRGARACPGALTDCLDLRGGVRRLATATADGNGEAALWITPPFGPGAPRIALQAAAITGGPSAYSPLTVRPLLARNGDEDGDGLPNLAEVQLGGDLFGPDADGDRFLDLWEAEIGARLDTPDSDGGGMPDFIEYRHLLDPRDPSDDFALPGPDADGDGLLDAEKLAAGTNPNNPDSDGDGLIDSYEVDTVWFEPLVPDIVVSDFLNDPIACEAPAFSFGPLRKLALGLDPLGCDHDGDFIYDHHELIQGSDPRRYDTDGGGIHDGIEELLGLNALDPADDAARLLIDPDGDGLDAAQELAWGTYPLRFDSDGDGIPDGLEIPFNFSPTDPATAGFVGDLELLRNDHVRVYFPPT